MEPTLSAKVDAERAEMALEARVERAKRVLQLMQRVSTLTYEGVPVAEMARRLLVDRVTLRFYQRVLGWRTTRPPKSRRGTLYGEAHHEA